jgi:hypothetical protein
VIVKKNILYLLVIALIPLGLAMFRYYRIYSVVAEAKEFAPRTTTLPAVPAGTPIPAILKTAFSESTKPGERVVAYTAETVFVHGRTALRPGTRLDGIVEQITPGNREALVVVRFTSVDAEPVTVTAPFKTDVELMGNALDTVTEAGVGTAFGAAAGNERAALAGMTFGALNGASAMDQNDKLITVVLTKALPLRSIRDDASTVEPADGKGNDAAIDGTDSARAS